MRNYTLLSKFFPAWLLFFGVMLGISSPLQAQSPGSVTVQYLKTTSYCVAVDSESGSDNNEYRWNIGYFNGNTGYETSGCVGVNSSSPNCFPTSVSYYPNGLFLTSNEYIDNPILPVEVYSNAWENDAGGDCTYDGGDQISTGTQYFDFAYKNYPPGILNTQTFSLGSYGFSLDFEFRRSIEKPGAPYFTIDPGSNAICGADPKLTFSTETYVLPQFVAHGGYGLSFKNIWEYSIGSPTAWSYFYETPMFYDIFSPRTIYSLENFSIRSLNGLTNITQNTSVYFRVKTVMTVVSGPETGGVFESAYSNAGAAIQLSPAPPNIVSVETTPSCPGSNTGTVKVTVTGLGEYLYVLRTNTENTNPCDPEAGTCGSGPSGRVFSNTFTISNVPKGHHTLIVANKGSTTGVCWNYQFIDVGEIPILTQNVSPTPASCFGAADGAVTLTASGGKAVYEYTLTQGAATLTSTDGHFIGLLAGTYTASIKDGCDQLVTQSVNVSQPIKIEATISGTSPSCANPTNGALTVTTTQGGGHYTYRLLKDSNLITELANTTNATWSLTDLSSGDYTVTIIDTDHSTCAPFSQTFSLVAPTTLVLPAENVLITRVSCYSQNNGSVELINGEGPGTVSYKLTNLSTSAVVFPSAAYKFENLGPGSYQLTKKRNVTGCLDQVDYPTTIEITEPQQVSITLTKNNIRCHGEDNGSIISTVVGATPTDSYQWEVNLAGSWVTLPQTTSSLSNLSSGIYRLKLVSSSTCSALSAEVEIIDPAVFSISNVEVTDIKCLGDVGRVVVSATGGFAPYTYHYSSTDGAVDVTTESAELSVGEYTLTLSDAGGCEIIYPEIILISAPSTPLSFTYTLSDFSGYNVPCQGSNGGYVDMLAAGGNGGTYSGYQYSIDGITYQSGARLENLRAGVYSIYVRDERGCTLSEQVTLTEPAAQIVVALISKTDVKCNGDLSGIISVSATGGSTPYSFLINGTHPQNTGTFSGLTSGDYTITVVDANGCAADYTETIRSLAMPMTLTLEKTDITCFGLSNGTLKAVVVGGIAPLRYEWSDKPENVDTRANLSLGSYTVRVVDAQGCFQNESTSITEPSKITPSSRTIPVCAGQPSGEIRMNAEGGTSPFQYSLNDKSNYQSSGVFTNILAGNYTIYVKDLNNCEVDYRTEVTVRNDKPEPDFIVASKENALDTLVIVEISVPKPDSIEWTFDPAIIILRNDKWSPEIKLAEAGVYPVSMKGYFGGCEYTKTLNLTIGAYDPEKKSNVRLNERAIKQIDLRPNPNNGTFNMAVELNFKQRVSISVFDVLGVVHFKSNWERVTSIAPEIVLPPGTPSGIYVVQVVTDTEVQQNRIIINR